MTARHYWPVRTRGGRGGRVMERQGVPKGHQGVKGNGGFEMPFQGILVRGQSFPRVRRGYVMAPAWRPKPQQSGTSRSGDRRVTVARQAARLRLLASSVGQSTSAPSRPPLRLGNESVTGSTGHWSTGSTGPPVTGPPVHWEWSTGSTGSYSSWWMSNCTTSPGRVETPGQSLRPG